MKKFSIAMLSMVLAGSMLLTGCGGSKTADSSSDAQDSTTSTSADGGTLRMGTNATFPPYEFVGDDGNVQGIDADIAAAGVRFPDPGAAERHHRHGARRHDGYAGASGER